MKIVFKRNTLINIDNVPPAILGIAHRYFDENGEFCVETNATQELARTFLASNGFSNTSCSINGTIFVNPAAESPQPRPMGTFDVAQHAEQEAAPQADAVVTQVIQENADTEEGDEEVAPVDIASTPVVGVPINDDEIMRRMPSFAPPEQGSQATVYLQKVNEFNRMWGQVITLKRQIDKLMKTMSESEIMNLVKSDAEYLSTKCPIVDSLSFKADAPVLVINTKEIVTSNQPKYGPRVVGKMQILIDLRYIYAATPPSTDFIKSIDIRNLDRNPREGNTYWVCGHAHHETVDSQILSICYGGYFQHIFDSIASKNLPQLFDTIIRFIQNPTEEDAWGKRISLFPRAMPAVVTNEA